MDFDSILLDPCSIPYDPHRVPKDPGYVQIHCFPLGFRSIRRIPVSEQVVIRWRARDLPRVIDLPLISQGFERIRIP